ncbi:hypothetical protein LPJ66_003879 [Kickxella alabastrina]|uniref:Uncharacterized protein n=1 Tax=Kickxella alabastrina TaxID=61397 RepID=A0ACC1INY6_9FUNG|nr:hypothetical protein LPJ66_003879 [Kickxella alabastrina]
MKVPIQRHLGHAELSRAITQAAGGRFFDLRRGRSDWEALSAEFNLSMAECLQLFDSSQSPIEARNMPCAHKWTNEDRRALCTLVGDTFGHMTADSWRLADTYMNTQQTVCFTAHGFWKKPHLTAGIYAEFHMLRGSGLKWKEIREQYAPYYRNDTSIASAFYQHKSKHPSLGSSAAAAAAAMSAWQAADRARIRELIWHHRDSIDADSLMQIASAEFPDKPAASTAKLCCNLLSEAKCKPLGQDALRQLQLLVNGHGEDWPRIGAEMQMFPERAQNNWVKYGKADEYVGGWSGDELEKLQYCIARDMAPSEAARYIGTKLPKQCWYKMRRIQRAGHL